MSTLVHVNGTEAARPERETGKQIARRPVAPTLRGRRTAGDVMTRFPPTLRHDASLWTAWDRLHRSRARHLVVIDDRRRPLGVLDERTVALEWPAGPMAPHRIPVSRLLRQEPLTQVRAGDDLSGVARAMLVEDADALPVVDREGRLFGLVTARHCVEVLADAAPGRER